MREFDFGKFIEETPPYVKINLTVEDIKKLANTSFCSINQYCFNCGRDSVFIYKDEYLHYFYDINGAHNYQKLTTDQINEKIQEKPQESKKEIYKEVSFYCAKCHERHEFFFTTDRNYIMKVGQNPSFSDLQGIDANKYKNLIPKYFIEFKSSLNCYSQHKGIAAFVYLRRILENLVEKKIKELNIKETKNMHFVDKLKKVQQKEAIIPSELEEIKDQLYKVLSKGVHEYEEEECLEMYDYVKLVIEEILDKQLSEKIRQEKIKKAKDKILAKAGENNG